MTENGDFNWYPNFYQVVSVYFLFVCFITHWCLFGCCWLFNLLPLDKEYKWTSLWKYRTGNFGAEEFSFVYESIKLLVQVFVSVNFNFNVQKQKLITLHQFFSFLFFFFQILAPDPKFKYVIYLNQTQHIVLI